MSSSGRPSLAPTPTCPGEARAQYRSSLRAGGARRERPSGAFRTARSPAPAPRLPRHRPRVRPRPLFSADRALNRPRVDFDGKLLPELPRQVAGSERLSQDDSLLDEGQEVASELARPMGAPLLGH